MKIRHFIIAAGTLVLFGVLGAGLFAAGEAKQATRSDDWMGISSTTDSGGPIRQFIRGQIGRWMALRSDVKLTPDQREQIAQVIRNHRQEIASALEPVIAKRRQLRDAVISGTADEQILRADADQLGKAIGDAAVVASKIKSEVRGLMTPQQRQSIDDFRRQSDAAVDQAMERLAGN